MTQDFDPTPGVAEELSPGLIRVLAPNPSPMTFRGTNSYVLGHDTLAVIDPGPDDPAHLKALIAAIAGRKVSHIVVTHSHLDHSPLSARLSAATAAPIVAFGRSDAGKSPVMTRLAQAGFAGGGEGIDPDFTPDILVKDGDILTGPDWALEVLHTPGHMGNHICLRWDQALFSGDLVMGWASSLVSPPDGDLDHFMSSLDRLTGIATTTYYPGHGAPILDPDRRVAWLRNHRKSREADLLAALSSTPQTIETLTQAIYTEIPDALLPAAARNVFAHLIDLVTREQVQAIPDLAHTAHFALRSDP